jgi:phosphoribosylamine--glycine ligase
LTSDIYDLFDAAIDGRECATEWSEEAMLGVVLASKGYPGSYAKGAVIKGTEDVEATIYHMGTAERDGELVTAGGRVMMVVGRGENLAAAREMAHAAIDRIECESLFHRRDIGHKVLD